MIVDKLVAARESFRKEVARSKGGKGKGGSKGEGTDGGGPVTGCWERGEDHFRDQCPTLK